MSPDLTIQERGRPFPWASLLLTLAAAAAFLTPGAAAALVFDRDAVAAGQLWRSVTGHFVHFDFSHLVWDLLVFAFLAVLCERDSRARFLACLALSSLAVSAAVWAFAPEVRLYAGLSGLGSALFALLVATIVREKAAARSWGWTALTATVFVLFLAKVAVEFATGSTVFLAEGPYAPVPVAHLAGAAVGLASLVLVPGDSRTRERARPGGQRAAAVLR